LKITEVAQTFAPFFSTVKVMGLAKFCGIFSQTHLVTLAPGYKILCPGAKTFENSAS
jgi:hypothetical protein